MKILFDFLTLHSKNGAAEYTRRVFYALLDRLEAYKMSDTQVYCLYDGKALPAYEDLQPCCFQYSNVHFIDIRMGVVTLNEQNFDVFFFGCAQNGGWHPEISELNCKSIIVFHDCVWEEMYNNDIGIYQILNWEDIFRYRATEPRGKKIYLELKGSTMRFCRWLLNSREHGLLEQGYNMVQPSLALLRKRNDSSIVTVSNYSKGTIMYNFEVCDDRIHVMYSPERVYTERKESENIVVNKKLDRLIAGCVCKYYLMVSANRNTKNAKKALRAFKEFSKINKDLYVVTIGYGQETFPNHIDLPFLNDTDLEMAYKNCYALIYPSLFEGFGYPPLEVMRYGKPVLASNVCSMPEILGDAPVYFSPFYESAIFNALMTLDDDNYSEYAEKSSKRYNEIHVKQENDLQKLVDMILQI